MMSMLPKMTGLLNNFNQSNEEISSPINETYIDTLKDIMENLK